MRTTRIVLATICGLGCANEAAAQRVLGDQYVSCEQVHEMGPVRTVYYSRLDVVDGVFVARQGGDYIDAKGKRRTLPHGKSGASAVLQPSSRTLAPGVRELKAYGEHVGFVITQSSSGKSWSTDGFLQTDFDAALAIPGVAEDDDSVSYRVVKRGQEVWRWNKDRDRFIASFNAPQISISTAFHDGEERAWLSGVIELEVLYRGRVAASYVFDVSRLRTEDYRMAIESKILGRMYRPGALPTGCVLKDND